MREAVLRKLTPADSTELFALVDHNRAELTKFWWEAGTQSPADSLQFINAVNEAERTNGAPTRAIIVDEAIVGVGALHTIDRARQSSLMGYWLGREYWGQGLGGDVARQLASLAFDDLGLESVEIATRASNAGSRAIAEKNGFTLQAIDEQPLWLVHEDQPVVTAHYQLKAEDFFVRESLAMQEGGYYD